MEWERRRQDAVLEVMMIKKSASGGAISHLFITRLKCTHWSPE